MWPPGPFTHSGSFDEVSRDRFQPPLICSKRDLPYSLGDPAALKAVEETAGHILGDLKMEFGTKEPSLSVRVQGNEKPAEVCLGKGAAQRLLSLLDLLPHGVMKISHDVEGLVSGVAFGLVIFWRDVLGSVRPQFLFLWKTRGMRVSLLGYGEHIDS